MITWSIIAFVVMLILVIAAFRGWLVNIWLIGNELISAMKDIGCQLFIDLQRLITFPIRLIRGKKYWQPPVNTEKINEHDLY